MLRRNMRGGRIRKPKLKKGSSIVDPIGKKNILQSKIPKNPKYSKVKGKINSGMNINKLRKQLGSQSFNSRYKRKEKFKRIKRVHLSRLMYDEDTVPFLLILDLRPEEEFEKCHLNNAINYPTRFLSRSVNEFAVIPQIYQFKNDEKKMVVIYDYNEEIGINSANTFFEKGFDNCLLLSGGLRRFVEKYDALCFGKAPKPPRSPKGKKKRRKRRGGRGGTARGGSDNVSVASYMTTATNMTKRSTKFDPKEHHWK